MARLAVGHIPALLIGTGFRKDKGHYCRSRAGSRMVVLMRPLWQLQPPVGQVQPVHDLVVLIVGRRVRVAAEGVDV